MVEVKVLTLVVLQSTTKGILLGMKKRGFGKGKWNGFGGKVEKGETIEAAAIREMKEESTVTLKNLKQVGRLEFEFVGDPVLLEVHIFTTFEYEGTPTETEEMLPKWFQTDCLPYDSMWKDDHLWYPLLMDGKSFIGYFVFDGTEKFLSYTLTVVDDVHIEKPLRNCVRKDTSN